MVSQKSDQLRISTVERDEAARLLGEHYAEGRLDNTEYDRRLATALGSTTRADIRPLFADLPVPHPSYLELALPALPDKRSTEVANVSDKSKIAAGVLQIVLPFGIGRFYTGHTRLAVAQLLVAIFTMGMGSIWSIVDGVLILVNGDRDVEGRPLRD